MTSASPAPTNGCSSAGFIIGKVEMTQRESAPRWVAQKAVMALLLLTLLGGCSRVFFLPSHHLWHSPTDFGLSFEDVSIRSCGNVLLHGWLLPAAAEPRGTILFLHGNAQNISTHIRSVAWLPGAGYNVLLIDYRGYGHSQGSPGFSGSVCDGVRAFQWLQRRPESAELPRFIFGQSLGGVIAANVAIDPSVLPNLQALVIDSAFASFRRIAREKLAVPWLTRPFAGPLSGLVAGPPDLVDVLPSLGTLPVLLFHGAADSIVPVEHGDTLAAVKGACIEYVRAPHTGHIEALAWEANRSAMLTFLRHAARVIHSASGGSDGPHECAHTQPQKSDISGR